MKQTIEQIVEAYDNKESVPFSGVIRASRGAGVEEAAAEKAFGFANRSERLRNTADTRFGIASGCKIFTAVAICQLIEQGKLSFETKLADCTHFEFPRFDPGITVHHLLTHSSGVPDYFDEETMHDFEELWRERPVYGMTEAEHFLPLFAEQDMKFAPGERFAYNNSGYILLGLIVEKVSGMKFRDYVESRVFRACGMDDSGYFRMDRLPERTALGYIDEEDGWKTNIFSLPAIGGPDGGAFTTAGDLDKFWDALLGGRLLSAAMTAKMLAPQIHEDEESAYGCGVWIKLKNEQVVSRCIMGFDPGVSMLSRVDAESGIRVHVLANLDGPVWRLAADAAEALRREE
ncbi:serine hydrolase [Saccharibacillus sp. CPCC 101409]|uniref:serine hydrolase domain-containing protein n=1 Tax=Saccharibacillus sp. CPCC 101409 TaxID=3058041 RepID=UPI002672A019|nr:serine hydrolase [Saccharibacillus sp. CPCC 101409]MDO3410338.1 serine hydrolase [Saccharibacillus sp. CPCC 101409]